MDTYVILCQQWQSPTRNIYGTKQFYSKVNGLCSIYDADTFDSWEKAQEKVAALRQALPKWGIYAMDKPPVFNYRG